MSDSVRRSRIRPERTSALLVWLVLAMLWPVLLFALLISRNSNKAKDRIGETPAPPNDDHHPSAEILPEQNSSYASEVDDAPSGEF